MFFNQYYDEDEIMMSESIELDTFEIEMLAEGMTGDYSDTLNIIIENNEEFHNLQEKMMKLEHCAIIAEDSDLLAEGLNDFKDKVADAIKNTWEKVKAYFKKLKGWLASVIKKDAKFLEKHGNSLKSATGSVEINFSLDAFNRADFGGRVIKLNNSINSSIDTGIAKSSIKDIIAKCMGFSSYSNMGDEVKAQFQKKSKLTGAAAFDIISNYSKDKETLDKLEKVTDEFFKKAISAAKDQGGENKSGKVAFLKTGCNIVTKYIGLYSTVLRDRKNVVRASAGKLIKGTNGSALQAISQALNKSESYGFGFDSVLDNF